MALEDDVRLATGYRTIRPDRDAREVRRTMTDLVFLSHLLAALIQQAGGEVRIDYQDLGAAVQPEFSFSADREHIVVKVTRA